MIEFTRVRPCNLGFLPEFCSDHNPKGAVEQIAKAYAHGGGWNDFTGFRLEKVKDQWQLAYPGDPPMKQLASAKLRDETIVLFEYDWVAVIQPDESFRVARID